MTQTAPRPTPLSVEAFGTAGWVAPQNHKFISYLGVVPLAAQEIGAIATDFPVYFGQKDEHWQVFTPLGANEGPVAPRLDDNGFLVAKSLPFLVNIYPFSAMPIKGNWVLSVWQDPDCVTPTGKAFFDIGEPSATVKTIQGKIGSFVKGIKVAAKAARALGAAGVLEQVGQTDKDGWAIWQVSEQKLTDLDADRLVKLHSSGALALAYTQVVSQVNAKAPTRYARKQADFVAKTPNDGFLDAVLDDINDLDYGDTGTLVE